MKKSVIFLFIAIFISTLSGCIISKSPNANNATVKPGETTTFSILVLPPGGTYTWTLDNAPLDNTTSSFQYTPTGGQHVLVVSAKHILGTDTQTWNITCPEVSAPIGSAGGTVEVTNQASPIAGAQAAIPAGALASTVTITITQVTAPAGLPSQPAGPCVDFGPDGTQFSTPVELSLPYPDADNDGIVDGTGISEDLVNAYYYNETTSAWENVPVIGRDKALNLVRIQTTHFSIYATSVSVLTFNKTYGGSGYNYAYAVKQTSDGGYILAGFSQVNSMSGYAWLIKTDTDGNKVWEKTFGESGYNYAYAVQQTSDGGYILAGVFDLNSNGSSMSGDAWLIKTDENGNKVWDKTFGESGYNGATDVQQTSDGGYILAGGFNMNSSSLSGDAWLIKTDASGNKVWDKTFGESGYDVASDVQQTSDGGYILAGYGINENTPDAWLIKTDANGNAPATPTP